MKPQPRFASFNQIRALEISSPCMSDIVLQQANIFSLRFPQSLGARWEGKNLTLSFVVDERLPADTAKYAAQSIDQHAADAYQKIFQGQDEIDLLLMDVRLVFSVLFWDGQELSELEFSYPMTDLLYLAA